MTAPDAAYGKRVKCPQCGNPIAVPGAPATVPAQGGHIQAPQMPVPPSAVQQPPPFPQQQQHYQQQYPPQQQHPQQQYPQQQYPQQQYPQQQQYPPQYQGQQQYQDQYQQQGEYPAEEGYEDTGGGRKRKKKGSRSDWAKVRSGVTFVLIGVLVLIGGMIFVSLAAVVVVGSTASAMTSGMTPGPGGKIMPGQVTAAANSAANTGLTGIYIVAILGLLVMISSMALTVLGNVFCINAPEAAGAKILALTSLGLLLVAVAFYVLGWFVNIFTVGMAANAGLGGLNTLATGMSFSMICSIISYLAFFAHLIVFQILLRALAVAMKRSGLVSNITAMMITGGVAIALMVVAFVILMMSLSSAAASAGSNPFQSGSSAASGGIMAMMMMCLSAIAMLTWGVWYIISLFMVRATISEKLGY